MLIRALIVLLVVLNLGAAAWWLTRPAPTPPAEPALPAGVARLQLVNEAPSMPTQAPVPQARDAVPPAALAACFSLGPYTRESSALQAQAALAGRILHARLREVPGAGTGGYQVVMPPAASLEEAQATAGRIGAVAVGARQCAADEIALDARDERRQVHAVVGQVQGRRGFHR
mgnify:CR=1 FL=1